MKLKWSIILLIAVLIIIVVCVSRAEEAPPPSTFLYARGGGKRPFKVPPGPVKTQFPFAAPAQPVKGPEPTTAPPPPIARGPPQVFENCQDATAEKCDPSRTCVYYTCESEDWAARVNENTVDITCRPDDILKCSRQGGNKRYCGCVPMHAEKGQACPSGFVSSPIRRRGPLTADLLKHHRPDVSVYSYNMCKKP